MTTITVVLPTFNERDNISALMTAVHTTRPDAHILVVDDDSPDHTWEVVAALAESDDRVGVIRRVGERGLTSAIQRGIDAAETDVVIWMDADGSMPASTIASLLAAIDNGADIAVGSRYAPGGRDVRDVGVVAASVIINLLGRLLLNTGVTDYTSGFVAARRDLLDRLRLRGQYGEYCIDLLTRVARSGRQVVEVGYVLEPRQFGTSKTAPSVAGFAQNGQRYIAAILRLAVSRQAEAELAPGWSIAH